MVHASGKKLICQKNRSWIQTGNFLLKTLQRFWVLINIQGGTNKSEWEAKTKEMGFETLHGDV